MNLAPPLRPLTWHAISLFVTPRNRILGKRKLSSPHLLLFYLWSFLYLDVSSKSIGDESSKCDITIISGKKFNKWIFQYFLPKNQNERAQQTIFFVLKFSRVKKYQIKSIILYIPILLLYDTGGGPISPKNFSKKNSAIFGIFGDIGTFGDMGKKIFLSFKNE